MLGGDMNLYSSGKNKPKIATGFANVDKALMTLENIKPYDKTYQKQVIITMYNRAKYHPNQTQNMRNAMGVFTKWMKKNSIHISGTGTKKYLKKKSMKSMKNKTIKKTMKK